MLLLTILYNLLMSGAVALAFGRVRNRRTLREGFRGSALVLGVALLLSILLGLGGRFRVMGLFAYGCFLYVPLALVGTSVLLRRSMRWTAPRLRFLCRPELVLLEIRGADGTYSGEVPPLR